MIEQIRSSDLTDFFTPANILSTPLDNGGKIDWDENDNQYYTYFYVKDLDNTPDADERYVINITLENKMRTDATVRMYLKGDVDHEDEQQTLGVYFHISRYTTENKKIVFKPKYRNFDKLYIQIVKTNRLPGDPDEQEDFTITINDVSIISNKISSLHLDNKTLGGLGIQGPPRMLFVVNDEGLRIGESGIFEAQVDDLHVEFFGLLPEPDDVFLIDYSYSTKAS